MPDCPLEPGLQFVEEIEEIPSPLSEAHAQKPQDKADTKDALAPALFALDELDEGDEKKPEAKACSFTEDNAVTNPGHTSHGAEASPLSLGFRLDEEEELEQEVPPLLQERLTAPCGAQ